MTPDTWKYSRAIQSTVRSLLRSDGRESPGPSRFCGGDSECPAPATAGRDGRKTQRGSVREPCAMLADYDEIELPFRFKSNTSRGSVGAGFCGIEEGVDERGPGVFWCDEDHESNIRVHHIASAYLHQITGWLCRKRSLRIQGNSNFDRQDAAPGSTRTSVSGPEQDECEPGNRARVLVVAGNACPVTQSMSDTAQTGSDNERL